MEQIQTGLVLTFNGLVTILTTLLDWKVLAGIALAIALLWLARLEVDDLDVAGAKPNLPRH